MSQQNTNEWNNSLFNCFAAGLGVCVCATFCPCCQYGTNVSKFGDSFLNNCLIYAFCQPCCCLCAGGKRTEMRNRYRLKEICINDCFTTCCCSCCSLIQVAAEIETRGVPQDAHSGPIGQQMA